MSVKPLVNSTPDEVVLQYLRTRLGNADSSRFIAFAGNCKESAASLKQGIAHFQIADFLGSGSAGIHEGEQRSIPLSNNSRRIGKAGQSTYSEILPIS